jgi:hypothetical protein
MGQFLLKGRHDSQIAVSEIRAAVGDALMACECSLRIEQPVAIDEIVRPVGTRPMHRAEHFQLEFILKQGIEQFQADGDGLRGPDQAGNGSQPGQNLRLFTGPVAAGQSGAEIFF